VLFLWQNWDYVVSLENDTRKAVRKNKDNIKGNFRHIGCEGVVCIDLVLVVVNFRILFEILSF
jgi:hypothetical protein